MSNETLSLLWQGSLETVYMTFISGLIATLGGLPLGIILLTTRKEGILQNKIYNKTFSLLVNVVRAIPFIILLVAVVPLTRLLVGSSIGTNAAIVPLSIAAIPFLARIVENALNEVGSGLVEAGQAMGATPLQIIIKILLPEALPAIINGITLMLITLIGYSAMAGAVGGGGLGAVAINYGYMRFDAGIMLATVLILIVMVYFIQLMGEGLANYVDHRK